MVPVVCFGSQNSPEFTPGSQKNQKIGKQVCFLAIEFSSDYWIRKKREKGVPSLHVPVCAYGVLFSCDCQREGGTAVAVAVAVAAVAVAVAAVAVAIEDSPPFHKKRARYPRASAVFNEP